MPSDDKPEPRPDVVTPLTSGATIGARISALREKRGWTRTELGKRIGTDYRPIHKWETGAQRPDRDSLLLLAGVFEVQIEELLGVAAGQDPPFAAWREFVASPQGQGITNEERLGLQSFNWPTDTEPTITGYVMLLAAIRAGTKPRT